MGSINMEKEVTAALVGGADEGLIYWDEKSVRTGSFKTARDLGRLAMVVGGLATAQWGSGKAAKYGENIAAGGTTLLVKSIIQVMRFGIVGQRTAFPVRYGATPRSTVGDNSTLPGFEARSY